MWQTIEKKRHCIACRKYHTFFGIFDLLINQSINFSFSMNYIFKNFQNVRNPLKRWSFCYAINQLVKKFIFFTIIIYFNYAINQLINYWTPMPPNSISMFCTRVSFAHIHLRSATLLPNSVSMCCNRQHRQVLKAPPQCCTLEDLSSTYYFGMRVEYFECTSTCQV